MKTPFLFLIKRPLTLKGNQAFRLDYLIMLIGIIISVTVVSTAINLFEGYQQTLKKTLLNSSAHIYIYNAKQSGLSTEQAHYLKYRLKKEPAIKSIQPVVTNSAMIRIADKVRGCMVKAYPNTNQSELWYKNYISQGSSVISKGKVILGERLANDLSLHIGDPVILLYPQTKIPSLFGVIPLQKTFILQGIVKTGYYEMDRSLILMQADDAFEFYNSPAEYTYLEINLKDKWIDKVDKLIPEYSGLIGTDYDLHAWTELNGNLFALISMEKWLIFLVFSFLIILAALNSISTVSTTILERKKEIALLKTLGMSVKSIKQVFYTRILLICTLSILAGLILGAGISWLLTKQTLYQLKGDVYFIDQISMQISLINYLAVFSYSIFIVGFCIRFPLKYVNKMQIVDILRGN